MHFATTGYRALGIFNVRLSGIASISGAGVLVYHVVPVLYTIITGMDIVFNEKIVLFIRVFFTFS